MCGRYQFDSEVNIAELQNIVEQLNKTYYGTEALKAMKTGEIFPTDMAPVITFDGMAEEPKIMRWGFPKWDSAGVFINARSETAEEKPLFKSSFLSGRCLIPATGFFEWQHNQGSAHKTKYLLRTSDYPLLYMAGLYHFHKNLAGLLAPSFVVLTTAANASMSSIHDRMPLILSGDSRLGWLRDVAEARSLLHSPCVEQLTAQIAEGEQLTIGR